MCTYVGPNSFYTQDAGKGSDRIYGTTTFDENGQATTSYTDTFVNSPTTQWFEGIVIPYGSGIGIGFGTELKDIGCGYTIAGLFQITTPDGQIKIIDTR